MFDFTACIDYSDSCSSRSFVSGHNFPNGTQYEAYNINSDWYSISCYFHKNADRIWKEYDQEIEILVLGQVFFRIDNEYSKTQINDVLKQVALIYLNEGVSVANYIKGNFILFIINKAKQSIEIITSKSCMYDIYYSDFKGKFFFSTSLENLLALDNSHRQVNPVSLIEHCIFDFPLGHKSLFSNVQRLKQGHLCNVTKLGFQVRQWHNWEDEVIASKQEYSWKQTHKATPGIFNRILKTQLDGKDKIVSALTGGFDSRTVLAGIKHLKHKNTLFYAWGKPESMDVVISKDIAQKLQLDHLPLYLEKDFEDEFVFRGKSAIRSSDGRATLRRANHFYSYSRLAQYSNTNFTGLYGSELLRPISAFGHTFNKNFFDLLISKNIDKAIQEIYDKEITKNFLNSEFLRLERDNVVNDIKAYFLNLKKDYPDYIALFIYHLNEGLVNYFGHEVHGTRFYVTTFSPYLDDEFIEFLLKTPVIDLNKRAFSRDLRKNIWDIRKGQMFYIPIIKKDYPALMNIITGRFYTPGQLANPLYPLSIAHAFIPYKNSRKHRSFGTEIWIEKFNAEFKDLQNLSDDFFSPMPKYSTDIFIDYAKQMSIRYWLSFINGQQD